MNDKDRADETHGAADALRPARPGGDPKDTGETDQRPDPALAIPRRTNPGAAGTEGSRGRDDRAAGHVDDPIAAGDGFGTNDFQTGDRSELSAQRGGPVEEVATGIHGEGRERFGGKLVKTATSCRTGFGIFPLDEQRFRC